MKKRFILVTLISTTLATGFYALTAAHNRISRLADLHSPIAIDKIGKLKTSTSWANQQWVGDDKPYQFIRVDIDTALATGQPADDLLRQSQSLAQQKPNDPQAQFRWSYTAWKVIAAQHEFYQWRDAYQIISIVLARASSPTTYNYARLRYLVSEHNFPLSALGERLLQRDPNDTSVRYCLCDDYMTLLALQYQQSHQLDLKVKERTIVLAQQLIREHPTIAKYYSNLGASYVNSWSLSKNRDDAINGLAAYQKYLKLASPDDDFRPHCQILMGMLEEYLSKPLAP